MRGRREGGGGGGRRLTCAEILRSIIVDVSSLSSGDDGRCGGGQTHHPTKYFFANNVSKPPTKDFLSSDLQSFGQQIALLFCFFINILQNFPQFISINSAEIYT